MSFPVIPNRYPLGITRILEKNKRRESVLRKKYCFFDKPNGLPIADKK
jgi:hypothetical protein